MVGSTCKASYLLQNTPGFTLMVVICVGICMPWSLPKQEEDTAACAIIRTSIKHESTLQILHQNDHEHYLLLLSCKSSDNFLLSYNLKQFLGLLTCLDELVEGRQRHLRAQNASHSLAFYHPSTLLLFEVYTFKKHMRK